MDDSGKWQQKQQGKNWPQSTGLLVAATGNFLT